jgi:hypothetical protein
VIFRGKRLIKKTPPFLRERPIFYTGLDGIRPALFTMQYGALALVADVLATIPWIKPADTVVSSSEPAVAVVYNGTFGLQPTNRLTCSKPFIPTQP